MTTHQKTRVIITLLIASTIAVIVMQAFWLSNAFRINQQKEKMVVQGAVKDAIDVVRLKTYFGIDSSLSKEQSSILRAMGGILDQVSNNQLKGVEIQRKITKDTSDNKAQALSTKKIAHEFTMNIGADSSSGKKKILDSILGAQLADSAVHSLSHYELRTDQPLPGKKPKANVEVYSTSSSEGELDTLVIGQLLDSLIGSNFDELQLKNRFKVSFCAIQDSLKKPLDSVGQYLQVRSAISPAYLAEITVEPDVLNSLEGMKWLLFVSLLILGMLFYTALALINSFNREKQMTEIKNDFISNMTHEFKTPIATASLAVELMSKFGIKDNPQKLDEYLQICGAELKRVSSMIETVLRLAQDNPYMLQKEPTDFRQILDDFRRQTRSKVEDAQGTLSLTIANDFPLVDVDKAHLENILYNLLDNSLKYSDQAPDIRVDVSLQKEYLRLSFSDNGIGIPKDYVDRVFDQFFRVPKGNVHATKGFGLGLSYVKKIVELHGGTIRVESQVGKGTTFILHIPVKS